MSEPLQFCTMKKLIPLLVDECYTSVSSFLHLSISSFTKIETALVSVKLILSGNRVLTAKVSSQFALPALCTLSNIPMEIQLRNIK